MTTGEHLSKLHPLLTCKVAAILVTLRMEGLEFGIPATGGLRTLADQQAIPKANTRVIDPRDSFHVWGLACDLVPINPDTGHLYWPPGLDVDSTPDVSPWAKLRAACTNNGLHYGGNFLSIKDWDHVELPGYSLENLKLAYPDPAVFIKSYANLTKVLT